MQQFENKWTSTDQYDPDDVLSCSSSLSCINRGSAVGCCPSTDGLCTNLYTTCYNYGDTCGSACEANVSILKWYLLPCRFGLDRVLMLLFSSSITASPYCGTFSFAGGSFLYNCQATSMFIESFVQYLADYYLTAIGSTLAPSTDPASNAKAPGTAVTQGATSTPFSSSSLSSSINDNNDNSSTGLAAAAIGGIAAGAGILICCIIGIIIFFCLRSRKRKRIAASQAMGGHTRPADQLQMQQQQTGYQSVPQQDTQYQGSLGLQPTTAGYYGGPTDPSKLGAHSLVSPVTSPSPSNSTVRPFSTVSSEVLSEQRPAGFNHPVPGGVARDYYGQPNSRNRTEVDGTKGNPGVPHGQQPGRMEVDGTQGNPGVPYDQHHHQGPYEMH